MALLMTAAACSPGTDDAADSTSATSGGEGANRPATEISLAFDVPDRDLDAGYTFAPGFSDRLGGGGPILSDNGRVMAFATTEATAAPTAQVVVGPIHAPIPDVASMGAEGPSATESAFPNAVSSDGRFVLFTSGAADLVADDTNERPDVFRYDRRTGDLLRVSLDSFGREVAAGTQPQADLSGDGNVVAFTTGGPSDEEPARFEPDCRGGSIFVVVRDLAAATTECVAVDVAGTPAGRMNGSAKEPTLSYDGRFVAFTTTYPLGPGDGNTTVDDIYVRDRTTGLLQRASVGYDGSDPDGPSSHPEISADGRFVAFRSEAANLVPDDTNGVPDVFVFDRLTGLTRRVSVAPGGAQADDGSGGELDLSWSGRFVAFSSDATNLADPSCQLYLHDLAVQTTECLDAEVQGDEPGATLSRSPSISADGRLVAFSSADTGWYFGGFNHVYVRVRGAIPEAQWPPTVDAAATVSLPDAPTLVSAAGDGAPGDGPSGGGSASEDGRWVAFWSDSANLASDGAGGLRHVLLRDTATGEITTVTRGANADSNRDDAASIALSADGRFVAFHSEASNLVPGDTNGVDDVFVYDRDTGETRRVSLGYDGTELTHDARAPFLSNDGSLVLYGGTNENVVPGVPWCGLVLTDLTSGVNECHGLLPDGSRTGLDVWALSGNGNTIVFRTSSDDFVAEDANGAADLIAYDRDTGVYELVTVASDGTQADQGASSSYAVSDDGKTVVFVSSASTLVPGDTNGASDVFLRNRVDGTTVRLSLGPGGAQVDEGSQGEVALDADGSNVVLPLRLTDDRGTTTCDLVALNRGDGTISCVPTSATGEEWRGRQPNISGTFVTFTSTDPLDASVARGAQAQVYVKRLAGGSTVRVPEIGSVPDLPPGTGITLRGPSDGEPSAEQLAEAADATAEPIEPDADVVALLSGTFGEPRLPAGDNDRAEFEETLGPPDAFTVRYEPGLDGSTEVRSETWIYFDLLTAYEFADGVLISYAPVEDPGFAAIPVPYHPLSFGRSTTWAEVQRMVADPGAAIAFEIPPEAGFVGTAYATEQLLVMFDDEGLTHVEAFPVGGGDNG